MRPTDDRASEPTTTRQSSSPGFSVERHIAQHRTSATPESAGPLPRDRAEARHVDRTRVEASVGKHKNKRRSHIQHLSTTYNTMQLSRVIEYFAAVSNRPIPVVVLNMNREEGLSTPADNDNEKQRRFNVVRMPPVFLIVRFARQCALQPCPPLFLSRAYGGGALAVTIRTPSQLFAVYFQ